MSWRDRGFGGIGGAELRFADQRLDRRHSARRVLCRRDARRVDLVRHPRHRQHRASRLHHPRLVHRLYRQHPALHRSDRDQHRHAAGVLFPRRRQEALRGLSFFFGLLFVTEVMLILVFGVDYRYVEAAYIGPSWRLGVMDFPLRMLVPCVVALALFGALELFLSYTFVGRAISAVAQDQLALRLMGASPIRIKRIAFGISIATAAVAGALLIIIQPVEPSVGREYIGRVFAICVLGGLGSLPGTVIAAMLLGIIESFTATFYGPSWAPAVAFGVLLLTLAFRPAGLLGR